MTTAVVLAQAPVAGRCLPRLEPLLGPDGCAALQAELVRRAAAWAEEVAPGRAMVELVEDERQDRGRRLAAVTARAFARHGGPVLVAGTSMPRLGPSHAREALLDMAEGGDVAFGPAHDGGFYLLALSAPHAEIFDIDPAEWDGPNLLTHSIDAAYRLGLEMGLLRMERCLHTPEDAAGLLADPLLAPEIRALLAPGNS